MSRNECCDSYNDDHYAYCPSLTIPKLEAERNLWKQKADTLERQAKRLAEALGKIRALPDEVYDGSPFRKAVVIAKEALAEFEEK